MIAKPKLNESISLKGLESLHLNGVFPLIDDILTNKQFGDWKLCSIDSVWHSYTISYMDIIFVNISSKTFKIDWLKVEKGYEGKYANTISIGSRFRDLMIFKDELVFDEDCVYLKNNKNLLFQASEDIEDLESVMDKQIIGIFIVSWNWH